MQKPLVTILVLTYRNFKYIFEAIDSIVNQNYENIEIIISNDFSDDFCEEELLKYIDGCRGENIKNIVIRKNDENVGTVKHANQALQHASGSYLMFLACDDVLNNESVISDFVNCFEEKGSELLLITSQVAMYNQSMSEFKEYALTSDKISKIINFTPEQMFIELSHTYTIPAAGTIYRREFYEKVGFYDEQYRLIEDSPMFTKMSRKGIKPWYLNIVSVNHRHGGISHGNTTNTSESFRYYWLDEILFFEKEILPFAQTIPKFEYKNAIKRYKELKRGYYHKYVLPKQTFLFKLWYLATAGIVFALKKILKKALEVNQRSCKGTSAISILMLASLFLIVSNSSDISNIVPSEWNKCYKYFTGLLGLILLLAECASIIIYGLRRLFDKALKLNFKIQEIFAQKLQ